jgi:hypothetical protein
MATDISNVKAFAETVATAQFPTLVTRGSAAGRLLIDTFVLLAQPIVDEIADVRDRQTLNRPDLNSMDADAVDDLLANIFVTRRPGAKATGQVRMFFLSPVAATIPQDTIFRSTAGLQFLAINNQSITQAGMSLNQQGDLFFFDVNVIAESEGSEFEVAADEIIEIQQGVIEGIVQVSNPVAFSQGGDRETNEQAAERAKQAITERSLVTDPGINAILRDLFAAVIDFQTVGFGDPEMLRDILSGDNLVFEGFSLEPANEVNIGGKVDIYLQTVSREVQSFRFIANSVNKLRGRDVLDALPIPATTSFVLDGGFATEDGTSLPGSTVLTDANAAFVVSALVGKTLRFLDGIHRGQTFTISANTATTIDLPSGLTIRETDSYVVEGDLILPIVRVTLVEEIDPVTFEALGNVLVRDVDYEIIVDNVSLNFSARSRLSLNLIGPNAIANTGLTFRMDYETSSIVQSVQDAVDQRARRVICADLLVKYAIPVFVSADVSYRIAATRTEQPQDLADALSDFISNLSIGVALQVNDIPIILSERFGFKTGELFLSGPLEVSAEAHAQDGTITVTVEQDQVAPDRTQTLLPGVITFTLI